MTTSTTHVSATRALARKAAETPAASGPRGKYRLIAELGSGGMARVYLALASGPQGFQKLAVIKQIREELADDPELLTMLLDEARLAARLNHPNVVQTNEVCEESGSYFISMEHLEGQPLKRILQRIQLPLGFHLRILSEALAGLHHAHELADYDGTPLHVVHRDATPSNVIVTYAGQVKVVDFGIAKAFGQANETKAGTVKGKATYMAPEQARAGAVDRRADIFSVGVMMWEALADRRMWKGLNEIATLQKVIRGEIPDLRSVNPPVDERLEAVCLKALARDPAGRYATAADFQTALEEALEAAGDRSHVRDAGKLVTDAFEPERERVRSLVEGALLSLPALAATFDSPFGEAHPSLSAAASTARSLPVLRDPLNDDTNPRRIHPRLVAPSSPAIDTSAVRAVIASNDPTTTAEVAPVARRRNVLLFPLAVAATIGILAAGYVVSAARGAKLASPDAAATSTSAPRNRYTLKLESAPPGAMVREGAHDLGRAPMGITLDGSQEGIRTFVLSLDGFADYVLRQDPPTEDTKVVAALTPASAPVLPASPPGTSSPVTSRRDAPRRNGSAEVTPTSPLAPRPSGSPLDIHLVR